MLIAITGAGGLVGRRLRDDLEADGHDVLSLTRSPATGGAVRWDPVAGQVDTASLEGVEAIVHLAGETVGQRCPRSARARSLRPGVDGTRTIAAAAAGLSRPPAVLVCASAVGYYGDRGDEELTDDSARGEGFLADVVAAWEEAARPAREAGVRVVHLRKGLVLTPRGGALRSLLRPFRLGVGGRIGSGRQWWPWLTLEDASAAYRFAIASDLEGAVNVAAGSTRNADFARALGAALGRPAALPLPSLAVRLGLGQMGVEMLLGGQRVTAGRLERAGFSFADADLGTALRRLVA